MFELLLLLLLSITITTVVALSSATTNRAWVVPEGVKFGDLGRLVLLPQEDIRPNDNNKNDDATKIEVATRAIGLNFADIFTVLGYYQAANLVREGGDDDSISSTFCPGLEFSGVIQKGAAGGVLYQPGDRVFGFTRFGAYQDVVAVENAEYLHPLPDNWTFEQGAAFLVNALTAWHGLVTVAGMPNDDDDRKLNTVVLVHSASGGVGLWASEIAARRGGIVIGVVGSEDKKQVFMDRVEGLCPAARCFVRSTDPAQFERDLQQAVVQARIDATGMSPPHYSSSQALVEEGWGIDFVMESYGGKYFAPSLNLINAGGSLATYGSTSYNGDGRGGSIPFLELAWKFLTRPRVDPGELTSRNVRVGGFNLIFLTERIDDLRAALDGCIDCLGGKDGSLTSVTPPVVGEVFDFDTSAVEALSALRSGKTVGKVVLRNPNNPQL